MRSRKDTVRCVMTTLTEEGHYLTDELVRNENTLDDDDVYEEENMMDWTKWVPDPVDANPCKFIFCFYKYVFDLIIQIYF